MQTLFELVLICIEIMHAMENNQPAVGILVKRALNFNNQNTQI